jgi:hypothetical protein
MIHRGVVDEQEDPVLKRISILRPEYKYASSSVGELASHHLRVTRLSWMACLGKANSDRSAGGRQELESSVSSCIHPHVYIYQETKVPGIGPGN